MTFTKAELVILQLNRFRDVPYEKLPPRRFVWANSFSDVGSVGEV